MVPVPVYEDLVCALLLCRRHHIIFNDAVSQEELYYPPHPKKNELTCSIIFFSREIENLVALVYVQIFSIKLERIFW